MHHCLWHLASRDQLYQDLEKNKTTFHLFRYCANLIKAFVLDYTLQGSILHLMHMELILRHITWEDNCLLVSQQPRITLKKVHKKVLLYSRVK